MAIESRWFRCPEKADADMAVEGKPPVIASEVESYASFRPEVNSEAYVVRAYAEPEVLDRLSDMDMVVELPDEMARNALNASEGAGVREASAESIEELNEKFNANGRFQ